mgnify:CR=1 FL=1
MSVQNTTEDAIRDVSHKEPGTDVNVTKDSHWTKMVTPAEVLLPPHSLSFLCKLFKKGCFILTNINCYVCCWLLAISYVPITVF